MCVAGLKWMEKCLAICDIGLCQDGWWIMYIQRGLLLKKKHGISMGREPGNQRSSICLVGVR